MKPSPAPKKRAHPDDQQDRKGSGQQNRKKIVHNIRYAQKTPEASGNREEKRVVEYVNRP
jgi:hypothetical protein